MARPRPYFFFPIFLMHFVQAFILFPLAKVVHCKFGYLLDLLVGLNLLLSFFLVTVTIDVFPQREHVLDIKLFPARNAKRSFGGQVITLIILINLIKSNIEIKI
jgi:hypothetical protein